MCEDIEDTLLVSTTLFAEAAVVVELDSKSTSFDVALVSLHMFGGLLIIGDVIE